MPCLSLRNSNRCVPDVSVTVEDILLSKTEGKSSIFTTNVGLENISSASRMNKAVIVLLKKEGMACDVIKVVGTRH